MINSDFHRAYGFSSPSYRALYTPKQFVGKYGFPQLEWREAKVVAIRKEGADAAKVEVELSALAFLPHAEKAVPVASVFTENWVRVDGEWWYIPPK